MPSIWTICHARTVLLVIVKTLASYYLEKADGWGQLFTYRTSRRQVSFQKWLLVWRRISYTSKLCMFYCVMWICTNYSTDFLLYNIIYCCCCRVSSCIFPEDERSETICKYIFQIFKEKVLLLEEWKAIHKANFGHDTHDIPAATDMHFKAQMHCTKCGHLSSSTSQKFHARRCSRESSKGEGILRGRG